MTDITGIASSALAAYGLKQNITAQNVANMNNPEYRSSTVVMNTNKAGGVSPTVSQGQDTVDISKEAVDMITTGQGFKANLKVLQAADEMTKELLNLKA